MKKSVVSHCKGVPFNVFLFWNRFIIAQFAGFVRQLPQLRGVVIVADIATQQCLCHAVMCGNSCDFDQT